VNLLLKPISLPTGLAISLAAAAIGMYLSYGSVSPCGALHSKVRSLMTNAAMTHLDGSKPGAALGSGLALMFLNSMPIEAMVDAKLTQSFGAAGPLQCTWALFQVDWSAVAKADAR
jgi:hypothetical protein